MSLLLILVLCGTIGTLLMTFVAAIFLAYISTHPSRRLWKRTPDYFGAEYEEVQFPSRDGLNLSGWFVPPPDSDGEPYAGTIVFCHGMLAHREELLPWAELLWKRGFALLLFDFRASGGSEGDCCTAGYYETGDLHGAVDYLMSRHDVAPFPIGVFGFSMGGATAINAAASDPRIQAVATHGAYATLNSTITQRCRHHFGPLGPLVEFFSQQIGTRTGWYPISTDLVAPVKVVGHIAPRPLLLLHGSRDPIVLPSEAHTLYAASGFPKEMHVLPNSGHKHIDSAARAEFESHLVTFFCSSLLVSKELSSVV